MSLHDRASLIASKITSGPGGDVKTIDPATIAIVLAILKQAFALLKWWKPEWFVSWQVDGIIDREVGDHWLDYHRGELKKQIMQELEDLE